MTVVLFIVLLGMIFMGWAYERQGLLHGIFYGKGNPRVTDPTILRNVRNIHAQAVFTTIAIWLAFALPCAAALLAVGLPTWKVLLVTAMLSKGGFNLFGPRFQMWIHRGCGLPDRDPNERYDQELFDWGIWVPKILWLGGWGRWRWLDRVFSVLLIGGALWLAL